MKQDKQKREEALEKRKRIEEKFGQAKKWHHLDRARYRGRWRVAIQALMTFFVINAKRMVKLLFDKLSPPGVIEGEVCLNRQKEDEKRKRERCLCLPCPKLKPGIKILL